MMATMKEWVTEGIRSSGFVVSAMLAAVYAPRGLSKMYFNLHLRRYARRLVPLLDPFVTIDIASKSSRSGQSSTAFEEAKAYLTKARDVLEFSAEGTVEGSSFLLSLGEGQEVADHFQGVTVWWLFVPRDGFQQESRLRLMFPQRHRTLILDEYLPHVRRQGREDMHVTIDIANNKSYPRPADDEFKSSDDALFEEVKAYLTNPCSRDALDLCAEATVKDDSCLLSLREGAEVADRFRGVTLWWMSVPTTQERPQEILRVMFPQQHRVLILDEYLPHVRRQGRDLMFGKRRQSLYTNKQKRGYYGDKVWSHIDFEHPATFDSLAMHPTKKRRIMEDLDSFRGNEDYYRRIGKPWKRGYLLYGPPGTGKSTMIAAMANYLNYDIHDIELTSVSSNNDLRNLFMKMKSKSIIVIEDIDCCFEDFNGQRMKNKGHIISSGYQDKEKVTMSGLLSFIDGVWSAQSGEQITVLTTNFPDKLDPSLTRRGRMDMHIEMSYCCFEAFKTLARNYLGIGAHPLFQRVEKLLQVVEIIPADVAECLLKADVPADSDRGVEACLGRLIDDLEKKAQEKKDNKAAAKPKRQRR